MIAWGAKLGPAVARVVELTLARYVNPEQGYRACLGLLRTGERYGAMRMNAACERGLNAGMGGGPRRNYIEAILKKGLELQPQTIPPTRGSVLQHENVRGPDYYDRKDRIH